jgi:flagellar protein FlbD
VNSLFLPPILPNGGNHDSTHAAQLFKVSVNSDLIKWVEQNPDTVITLLNGEKLLVQETVDQVVDRVVEFRRQLLSAVVSWTGMRAGALPVMYLSPEGHKESEG